jgi:hypothetical protein
MYVQRLAEDRDIWRRTAEEGRARCWLSRQLRSKKKPIKGKEKKKEEQKKKPSPKAV